MLFYMILLGVLAAIIYLIQFHEYSHSRNEVSETDVPVTIGSTLKMNLSDKCQVTEVY